MTDNAREYTVVVSNGAPTPTAQRALRRVLADGEVLRVREHRGRVHNVPRARRIDVLALVLRALDGAFDPPTCFDDVETKGV